MIGIVYKAIDNANNVVKIGSTIKSLSSRQRDKCYSDCTLIPVRTDDYEDSPFGILLLRTRELFEISKYSTWRDQGGRNILNPVRIWLNGADDFEMRSYAGTIGGTKTFALYGNPATKESCKKAGTISGRKHAESGHMSALGKQYGGRFAHILEIYRTPENQTRRAILGGRRAAELGVLDKALHVRWHVNRNIKSPTCKFCVAS